MEDGLGRPVRCLRSLSEITACALVQGHAGTQIACPPDHLPYLASPWCSAVERQPAAAAAVGGGGAGVLRADGVVVDQEPAGASCQACGA